MWFILFVIVLGLIFYLKYVAPMNYWGNLGVPYKKGLPILGKQLPVLLKQMSLAEWFLETYKEFPKERFSGSHQFNRPVLVLRDPELIKDVTIKMFDSFPQRVPLITKTLDYLFGRSLLNLLEPESRSIRHAMTPAFTSSKMKAMYVLMSECAEEFTNFFKTHPSELKCLDSKDAVTRYVNDVISNCIFGVKTNSLVDRENEFLRMGKRVSNFGTLLLVKAALYLRIPDIVEYFKITVIQEEVKDYFMKLIREGIEYREKNNIVRPDLIHILKEARKGKVAIDEEIKSAEEPDGYNTNLSDEDIAAQALFFYIAGFNPVTASICFMAHELALNADIQKKLRDEIKDTHGKHGNLSYEAVSEMKYLDMVVSETLRKWPAAIAAHRSSTKPVTIQSSNGKNLQLKEGSAAIIPIIGLHRDPKYYPNPEKFDPERFSEENKNKIIPYTYLPFGNGPRNCIGARFVVLKIKAFFVHLLLHFELTVVDKTPIPIKFSTDRLFMDSKDGFWIGLEPLSKEHE